MAYYIIVCVNYLCISYVLFVDISTRSFDDFVSMNFLIAGFLPASPFILTFPFINFGDFCQLPCLLHPPRLLFWPKFAGLPVYSALPFYLKLESMGISPAKISCCERVNLRNKNVGI